TPGECFVFSPGVLGFPMSMRARHSPHLAHTPGLDQLRTHIRRARPVDLIAGAFATNTSAVTGVATKDLPTTGGLVQPQQTQTDASGIRSRPQTMLERALEAWNAGHQT